MQSNSINSAIWDKRQSIDILRVKYGGQKAKRHLLGSISVCWFGLPSVLFFANIVWILFLYLLSTFAVNKCYNYLVIIYYASRAA